MDENVGIVIGIEAQKSFYPGYDLVTRGIYYAARMISSQMGVEFTGENYNQIKRYIFHLDLYAGSEENRKYNHRVCGEAE